ncbi:phage holin [Burkholderia vietnamiensis]|uniref:phage holin n=1 Tax=Burkholderia vietnamiensis TaxID=60552 RepID=UPI001FC88415|nr:phage holin [Burkholderia vietnamiensis]
MELESYDRPLSSGPLFFWGEWMQVSPTEAASYAGSGVALGASLTLTQVGVIVGIATAILTFASNLYFQWRDDQRKQRESDLRIEDLEKHDG